MTVNNNPNDSIWNLRAEVAGLLSRHVGTTEQVAEGLFDRCMGLKYRDARR